VAVKNVAPAEKVEEFTVTPEITQVMALGAACFYGQSGHVKKKESEVGILQQGASS
jgi:hypothetical protein